MTGSPAAKRPNPPAVALDFNHARMLLRAPFTPEAVKWKVLNAWADGGQVVAYIDARLVIERLNLIVGGGWSAGFEPAPAGAMWCHLTVCDVTRRDIGEGTGKGLVSDALKRAAVHFGVGVSLYAIPTPKLTNTSGFIKTRQSGEKNGRPVFTGFITDQGAEKLRAGYRAWLDKTGREHFGEPFDHGDALGALGDFEALASVTAGQGDELAPEDAAKAIESDFATEPAS